MSNVSHDLSIFSSLQREKEDISKCQKRLLKKKKKRVFETFGSFLSAAFIVKLGLLLNGQKKKISFLCFFQNHEKVRAIKF